VGGRRTVGRFGFEIGFLKPFKKANKFPKNPFYRLPVLIGQRLPR